MEPQTTMTSSVNSTDTDTSQFLHELMNLQKTSVSSGQDGTLGTNVSSYDGEDAGGSGEAMNATLTELMKTLYNSSAPRQLISLQGSDAANSFCVYSREVDIVSSKSSSGLTTHSTGSNKVKITPVVNFDWEVKRYVGNIVAVHRNHVYAAYALRVKNSGVVRVINRRTAERALFKKFTGQVIDLAFSHTDEVLIAIVDEIGNLLVSEIRENPDGKLVTNQLLMVNRPSDVMPSEFHRVVWCPFIPDDCDDSSATESSTQDASRVLVLTHKDKAEIWSVDFVTKEHGSGPIMSSDVDFGLITVDSHTEAIMDAAFSPDGTALATASLDGEVKFFQVYLHERTSPRCLHQWRPHDGKPVSCLFFLDDHKNISPDTQFWKFAVTGANNNREIKLWSCESWTCLQTIRFLCPDGLPSNFKLDPVMKAAIDQSARYLILSDIRRKVLYVLQIHQDANTNTAHVSSVSEFVLAQPCLSFAVLDASAKKLKKSLGNDSNIDEMTTGELEQKDENEEEDGGNHEEESSAGVQVKLYTVHPRTLQELLIRFRPDSSVPQPPPHSASSISQDETGLRDALSDLSMSLDTSITEGDSWRGDIQQSLKDQNFIHPLLLTPEAFTSSPRKLIDSDGDNVRMSGSSTSSFTHVTAMNDILMSPVSSGDQSLISVGSTVTQTPTSKEQSPGRSGEELTPTSVPQREPVDSTEEQELKTPKSVESVQEDLMLHKPLAASVVDNMFPQQEHFVDIQSSLDTTASTGAFEVNELTGQRKKQISYDENDEEVAEVMGEDIHESSSDSRENPPELQPFSADMDEQGKPAEVMEITADLPHAWPKPPDVGPEASRIEKEVIQRSSQDEDDVQIEEEIEEEEDEDEMEDTREVQQLIDHSELGEEDNSEEIEEQINDEQLETRSPKEALVAGQTTTIHMHSQIREQPVHIREIHKETVREVLDKETLGQLQTNIQSILTAIETQQDQIEQLRMQVCQQQEAQAGIQRQQLEQEQIGQITQQPQPSIEEHIGKLENIVASRVERLFTQHSQKENQRVQDILRQSESREKQKHDRLQHTVTQTLNSAVSNIDRSIKAEMKNTVVPNVSRSLDTLKEQLHQELAQKLTATDSLLKDNIGKMVRSRQTVEAISMAAGNALQTPIQAAYRESFQNIVIPAFEQASQAMFQQMNDSFSKGTKEYIRHLETNMEQLRQKHLELRDPIVSQLRTIADSFQTSSADIQTQVLSVIKNQFSTEIGSLMTHLQEKLVLFVREAVKEEVGIAVREQGASISDSVLNAMRSGAVTPVQLTPDPHHSQSHILNLLRQGQLNVAFQQALSAANLDLVTFVCETVNPSQVFNQTPCPLQQPVLLSLIQQLSADLGANTEMKHKYLEEAIMNLDKNNPVTQEHISTVLEALVKKLNSYISEHPNDKIARSLKMLQMASESLLK